ncbi:MAG TPA: D-alanyl-D-alanine carboxypeptidase/D-alanyl-D-alanine-endopeptidase [Bryobacteraceae bacterium]|nr:D-alanyl-D-alanine carboxypeptidase/D-alanyl-D-alanine-endopeptidase [Bryobacteraceae bacterium]HOL71190.1 D-alanyl-D-alanine carboxypeptidase/D-alanyl-D-alanine-endopeptidase [Bryobacteraceae bacterium]HOQ47348.1 D-alanyl-D-alanine carboxypeptidase/D-alanyl-D-alanine-endopeptidase [Bryobacteraceae bacterium]HPQ15662.1 D-alanyl-D-alanine carboxypeptidase/D-alanyl-D-alanine-endopeptidase [Bryobacteraceae bacterium]HPU73867.1 D-alanyl-D-alanine carboxypeptidase/D-alanyl-D-alanine-endopeptidase
MRWIPLFLLFVQFSPADTLRQRIESAMEASAGARGAFWGMVAVELETGTALYETNANRFFVPASTTKLVTTALALARLGPDYRFETTVCADAPPDARGRIAGELRLVGGGDPMLTVRVAPYQRGQIEGNPLQAIETLAEQVCARGVRRIDGDIVGDDTIYTWEPYPEGWSAGDPVWDYGAPVSALAVSDNTVRVTLRATARGTPVLSLLPALEFYTIDNRVRAGPGLENKVFVERLPGSRQLRLWGTMSSDPPSTIPLLLAVHDPALYAAHALADALARRGVSIGGRAVARHRFANEEAPAEARGVVLARRTSPPLIEALRVIDKVSQNLHAEMVLREVARIRRGKGSREAGLEEMRAFLTEVGVGAHEYDFADGSGLSRLGLVTPGALCKLLRYMYDSPHRETWLSLLPLGGEDGTLSTRFNGRRDARRIRAKTGSLTHVATLAGYAESKTRGMVAFAILANNFNAPGSEIRAVIDRIALMLTE